MIGIKDTQKQNNYLVTVGAVSFQLTMDEAKTLAMKIENMFSDKEKEIELIKQTRDKSIRTKERIDLIFKLKGDELGNAHSTREYPIGKIA